MLQVQIVLVLANGEDIFRMGLACFIDVLNVYAWLYKVARDVGMKHELL